MTFEILLVLGVTFVVTLVIVAVASQDWHE